MTNVLQELATKAGMVMISDTCYDKVSAASLQEFAELILKEYEKILPEYCPANVEGPMKGWHVQFVARKHFGVE